MEEQEGKFVHGSEKIRGTQRMLMSVERPLWSQGGVCTDPLKLVQEQIERQCGWRGPAGASKAGLPYMGWNRALGSANSD